MKNKYKLFVVLGLVTSLGLFFISPYFVYQKAGFKTSDYSNSQINDSGAKLTNSNNLEKYGLSEIIVQKKLKTEGEIYYKIDSNGTSSWSGDLKDYKLVKNDSSAVSTYLFSPGYEKRISGNGVTYKIDYDKDLHGGSVSLKNKNSDTYVKVLNNLPDNYYRELETILPDGSLLFSERYFDLEMYTQLNKNTEYYGPYPYDLYRLYTNGKITKVRSFNKSAGISGLHAANIVSKFSNVVIGEGFIDSEDYYIFDSRKNTLEKMISDNSIKFGPGVKNVLTYNEVLNKAAYLYLDKSNTVKTYLYDVNNKKNFEISFADSSGLEKYKDSKGRFNGEFDLFFSGNNKYLFLNYEEGWWDNTDPNDAKYIPKVDKSFYFDLANEGVGVLTEINDYVEPNRGDNIGVRIDNSDYWILFFESSVNNLLPGLYIADYSNYLKPKYVNLNSTQLTIGDKKNIQIVGYK